MVTSRVGKFVLVFRVLLFAAAVPLLLRLGIKRLPALLSLKPPVPLPPGPFPEEEIVRNIASVTNTAVRWGRPFVKNGCLTRGLTQCYFLRKQGVDVSLVFGLDLKETERTGHCWLEMKSRPVLEKCDPHSRFTEILRIPARP